MTGCGNGSVRRNGWEVTAELKTVNHRFLDLGIRLPRNLNFLEQNIRDALTGKVIRGHVDVYLSVRNTESSSSTVLADPALARSYYDAAKQIAEAIRRRNDLTVKSLMSMEGIIRLSEREMDQDTISSICNEALGIAVGQLIAMREKEGKNLKADLLFHLEKADKLRTMILGRAPAVVNEYSEKLTARLKKLITDGVEPQRLAQEVALMADRCAIDEELARLNSHIEQMRSYLEADGEIGKKMDFLIQEMNREANTIGSKASDAQIAQMVVDLKSEIEKLREQIQNVE